MTRGVLTQDDFDKLLGWLDPDRDKAGEKYAKIQLRLIRIFSARGCNVPEELADKTINVVASKVDWLIENYVGDPALYFYAVGKKIFLEWLKSRPAPPQPPPPNLDQAETERICGFLDECLHDLPSAEKILVLRYHEGEKQPKIKNRQKLAEELKISRNALRIRVHHIHARLRECVERLERNSPE